MYYIEHWNSIAAFLLSMRNAYCAVWNCVISLSPPALLWPRIVSGLLGQNLPIILYGSKKYCFPTDAFFHKSKIKRSTEEKQCRHGESLANTGMVTRLTTICTWFRKVPLLLKYYKFWLIFALNREIRCRTSGRWQSFGISRVCRYVSSQQMLTKLAKVTSFSAYFWRWYLLLSWYWTYTENCLQKSLFRP